MRFLRFVATDFWIHLTLSLQSRRSGRGTMSRGLGGVINQAHLIHDQASPYASCSWRTGAPCIPHEPFASRGTMPETAQNFPTYTFKLKKGRSRRFARARRDASEQIAQPRIISTPTPTPTPALAIAPFPVCALAQREEKREKVSWRTCVGRIRLRAGN